MSARAIAVLVALLLASAVARAQDSAETRAAELFRAGSAAYERGDYPAAARAFEEANRQAPAPATEYNAGLAWEAAGEKPRAANAYAAALAHGLAAPQATDATKRLAALDAALARLHVETPPGARVLVDGAPVAGDVRVQPGTHVVSVGSRSRHVSARAGAVTRVRFEATPPPAPPAPAPVPVAPPSSSQRTWGYVAVGGGVVLGGAAVFLGLGALAARDDFNNSGHTDATAHDRAASLRLWTNVAWAGAAVAAGTGVVLLVTAPSRERGPSARVVLGPGSLALDGRF